MPPAFQNAIVRETSEAPGTLRTIRVPIHRPRPGHVLVRTRAACLDPIEASPATGLAGEIVLVGAGVTGWSSGDRVAVLADSARSALIGADFIAAAATDLHALPRDVSFIGAASVAHPFATAWEAVFRDGRLGMGEPMVVMGAAHPAAPAAVQIGRWRRSRMVVVADGRQAPRLRAIGADLVVSRSAPDLAHHVTTGLGGPAALVIDTTGGSVRPMLTMLGEEGRLVVVVAGEPQPVELDRIVAQRIRVIGSRPRFDTVDIDHILKLLADGTFVPVIDSIHPFSHAPSAARRRGSPDRIGSVLLVPDSVYESSQMSTQVGEEG